MAKFCTGCGKELSEGILFCTECGTKVPAETSAPIEPPAAPVTPPAATENEQVPPPVSQPVHTPPKVEPQPQPQPQPQPVYQQAAYAPPPPQQTYQTYTQPPAQPAYPQPQATPSKVVGTGAFFGLMFLFAIPIIGWLICIIMAFAPKNKNLKNFARAQMIWGIIGFVLCLILFFAGRFLINTVINYLPDDIKSGISDSSDSGNDGGFGGLLDGLLENNNGSNNGGSGNPIDGQSGGNNAGSIEDVLGALGGLEGLFGDGNGGSMDDIIGNIEDANNQAAASNSGWPATLRAYPGGTETAVTTYRTEIADTTEEEMKGWIDNLKKDGFEYQDFYEFGLSEADMLSSGSWWGYDGKTYLSVSFFDGKVTVDHTNELPDLSEIFG